MTYDRINHLVGWSVFGISLLVYLLTVAPTASFWDCGEFIACANELQVTHPPGAPLFMLMGRIMAMLAFDPSSVAYMVNLLSVLAGAFTALFTCWVTTIMARRMVENKEWPAKRKLFAVMASGVVAGLTCTFADSIWFNAVEAEVYAMSGFFTALVVWLMFKWEARADEPDHLKWIILIAYVMGLSAGVHLLNLLTIPALALIYFFRKFPFSWRGLLATMGVSVLTLAAIQYGILQYSVGLAREFELLFAGTETRDGVVTGGWSMGQGMGALVMVLMFVTILVAMIWYSQVRRKVVLNTVLLSLAAILIGASSYTTIYLRSNANPAIDMNNPENVLTFLSYMKREQYGDRPLLYGPLYNAQIKRNEEGYAVRTPTGMKHMVLDGRKRYVEDVEEYDYEYDRKVLFPRMYEPSRYRSGPYGYTQFVEDKGEDPDDPRDDQPTRLEDLTFFLQYQLGHMYFRYFFWNFVGRESDIQDDGWESGLAFWKSNEITSDRQENKGRNHYYFLPLLLGMLGIMRQVNTRDRDAAILGFLFFFTGIAIVLYLNQYPGQPRERDYSYAGSFQAFSIWVGLGVLGLLHLLDRLRSKRDMAGVWIAAGVALLAPLTMAVQNWDDHTRKGRYVDIEFAKNLLDSCAPNAILFTGGDNDTFPLWYVQEVEGYRTDVRVANLELLISDWYIDQMKSKKNDSEALPISMKHEDYQGDQGMVIYQYPSRTILLPVDKEACVANGVLSPEEAALADTVMEWDFRSRGGSYLLRKDSVIIDIVRNIAADGWKRPIYFGNTMPPDNYASLTPYFRNEGLAYRVVPLRQSEQTVNDEFYGTIRLDIMEENLLTKFKFTGLDDPNVNLDEHIRNVIISNYRNAFYRLSAAYAAEYSRRDSMVEILQLQLEGDSLNMEPSAAQAQIQRWKDEMATFKTKTNEVLLASDARIPHEAITHTNLYLLLRQAAALETVGDPLAAQRYYEYLREESIQQLKDLSMMGQEISQRSIGLQAALFTLKYYAEVGNRAVVENLSRELDSLMGVPISQQFLQQFQTP